MCIGKQDVIAVGDVSNLRKMLGLDDDIDNEATLPRVEIMPRAEVRERLKQVGDSLTELLYYKNCKYRNSLFTPLAIFSDFEPEAGVTIHINEKLARIKENHGENLKKNDVADLMGYLRFLCVIRGWTDFKDLMD